ncbi:hypothetical protein GZ212_10275 [Mangrovimonas sp. CR14]|uniref:putative capsular polysaccharide synthesis family protein n=1 Tax=Mangrovimonas sp. CR14 TaxID=2706120 RepID=UPI001421A3D1|nr:putative capsular polysaccharide synthesis family protein [Mangrovimonas sp. CR14]NIK92534.1 hypothetical protein [Mangrovimonas sp. CR14]
MKAFTHFKKQLKKTAKNFLLTIRLLKRIEIITVAKVGSASFKHVMKHDKRYLVNHGHSLLRLRTVLKNNKNTLIIVGVRNPIDRNLSYLFQTYARDFYNDVRTKKNGYKGEYCFICSKNDLSKMDNDDLIQKYFKMGYHNTFNDWFYEFFEITGIDKMSFNKEKGLQCYKLPNNNTVMIYVLEKLNNNKSQICKYLNIEDLPHFNNSEDREYKTKYQEIKSNIKYPKSYLDRLLKTDIIHFFYTEEEIEAMYKKYKTFD